MSEQNTEQNTDNEQPADIVQFKNVKLKNFELTIRRMLQGHNLGITAANARLYLRAALARDLITSKTFKRLELQYG